MSGNNAGCHAPRKRGIQYSLRSQEGEAAGYWIARFRGR